MTNNKERREQALSSLEKEIRSRDRREKTKPLTVVAASLAVILVVVGGIWYAATRTTDDESITAEESTAPTTTEVDYQPLATSRTTPLAETVTCTYDSAGEASREVSIPTSENVPATGTTTVTLKTNRGDIGMELDRSVSPCTVNAVEHLATEKFYDDTVCHRITTSGIHVLQCGDPSGTGAGGPGFQFPNEFPTDEASDTSTPVIYGRGTIAMANAGRDTNGSQFFLNYQDSPLPPMYSYFGQIDETGLATLDAIAEAGAEGGASDGAPAEEVRIETATVSS
ncbi:peptidylprolyl isomerase [Corynebacterium pacaense]|uniref:peptidylprolyl isomerase n=1 Tax=Corynebacterium pacaense TaxID=1816684 RepID=UPI0009BB9853|nr:peptidylprolyl isomerase [Corynebacterium pacaense]